ncbi:MAG: lipoyl(octanoyl) transferase LipB [Gemmatimonadaceae bacterium]
MSAGRERALHVVRLGAMPYAEALELQRDAAHARIAGELREDLLLLVEHPPVVTLGRTAKNRNLIASRELLATRGVELFEIERGGDVTFHGPGQLVGYPIVDLKQHTRDLHWYLRQVEQAVIHALVAFGIAGELHEGYTGVWTGGRSRKICSIGVHARDWVTWHGFALNITTDLSYFDLIIPCGISGVVMTSVARETGRADIPMHEAEDAAIAGISSVFGLEPAELPREALAARRVAAG